MLKLINKIYRTDNVTLDIIEALTGKLNTSEEKINDLYKQIFLEYATWYLDLKENEMAIEKRSKDITERRNIIKTRLLGVGPATKAMIEGTVNSVDGITIEIGFKDMTVLVTFLYAATNKYITLGLNTLKAIIPYHLDLWYTYNHVTWGELNRVTWQKTMPYTWGDVNDSVEGTIEKQLSAEW